MISLILDLVPSLSNQCRLLIAKETFIYLNDNCRFLGTSPKILGSLDHAVPFVNQDGSVRAHAINQPASWATAFATSAIKCESSFWPVLSKKVHARIVSGWTDD